MPILFFRVGYMEKFDGPDEIHYAGTDLLNHGESGEMWNFREEVGRCYGFVWSTNFAGIDLSRLDNSITWETNDELNGVDIVFISKTPPHGQVIIGWYRNATVFHKKYRIRPINQDLGERERLHYLCEVDSENAVLLPETERTYGIPHGAGFPGTSHVWYADTDSEEVAEFLVNVKNYINQNHAPNPEADINGNRGGWRPPNKELIARIEQAAIDKVWTYYEKIQKPKYKLKSVEMDNRGWDLEAKRNRETLYLEVKGHIGNVIQFELTPNEYAKMQKHSKFYRVCVVRNALDAPDLVVFVPKIKEDGWYLVSENGNQIVKLSEKIAAKASEVESYD